MTPNEARQRNLCYSGNLYVDMLLEVQYIDYVNALLLKKKSTY